MTKFALCISLMMIAVISVSNAQIYKWTDSQGLVHFSDTPHDGAEKLKIPEAQTFSAPTIPKVKLPEDEDDNKLSAKDHSYKKVAITQPLNEATIWNNNGSALVQVELDPSLAKGDKVQLLFDGSPLGEPQDNLLFQLNGVYRGAHTLAVQVLDENGAVLITSDTITFFMQRARVGMGAPAGR